MGCSPHAFELPLHASETRRPLNDEEMEWLLAIDESHRSANMKRCYICGTWTRNPISSPAHKDCPHSACRLQCLLPMETAYVALNNEMHEIDIAVRPIAVANSNNAIDSHTHIARRQTNAGFTSKTYKELYNNFDQTSESGSSSCSDECYHNHQGMCIS